MPFSSADTRFRGSMDKIWTIIGGAARVGAWAGAAMLLLAALVVTGEIVLRKVVSPLAGANYNLTGSEEVASYLFAVGTSWSLAHVLVTRGHVRIDALYERFPASTRALLDLIALALLGLLGAVLLERAGSLWLVSYVDQVRSNTTVRVPLAIPQAGWVLGLALFQLAIVVAFLRSLAAFLRRDYALVAATIGATSQVEEIQSELDERGLGVDHSKIQRS